MSIRDFVEVDESCVVIGQAFSDEEADRLDKLMERCYEVADEVDANIYKIGVRVA